MKTRAKFRITYSVITEDSATHGDHAAHGFLTRHGELPSGNARKAYLPKNPARFSLRDALDIINRHDSGWEPREADSFPCAAPRWFTVSDWPGYMPDAGTVQLSLHLDGVTPSTACRIARLAGVKLSR